MCRLTGVNMFCDNCDKEFLLNFDKVLAEGIRFDIKNLVCQFVISFVSLKIY